MASQLQPWPKQGPAPVFCSPGTPWGIHAALHAGTCPRCGWSRCGDRSAAPVPPSRQA